MFKLFTLLNFQIKDIRKLKILHNDLKYLFTSSIDICFLFSLISNIIFL